METVTLILPLEARTMNNPSERKSNSVVTAGVTAGVTSGALVEYTRLTVTDGNR